MNGVKGLTAYQKAYDVAMEIFNISRKFPIEEKYSLTDQIRRSSRAVCANMREAYQKRLFPRHFRSKLTDSDAELSETLIWLDFAGDCGYLSDSDRKRLVEKCEEVGKMLGSMIMNPTKFSPRNPMEKLQKKGAILTDTEN